MRSSISKKCIIIPCLVFFLFLISIVIKPYTSIESLYFVRTPAMLSFQKQIFELSVGESIALKVNRINVRVSYSSSNFKIASVNKNGKVTAKRKGTVIIYGKIGKETVSCKVIVKEK